MASRLRCQTCLVDLGSDITLKELMISTLIHPSIEYIRLTFELNRRQTLVVISEMTTHLVQLLRIIAILAYAATRSLDLIKACETLRSSIVLA